MIVLEFHYSKKKEKKFKKEMEVKKWKWKEGSCSESSFTRKKDGIEEKESQQERRK